MKLVLNRETCDRHGQCVGCAPSLLAWNPDGSLRLLKEGQELAKEEVEEAQDACALCPTQSLSIEG